ncbi:MAG: SOS response-associated peptidase [Rhizobiaceae bacterium]|nr:SOS response-associated peptidase [Rhizobiaceae bacterium]
MCGRFSLEVGWEELFAYFNMVRPAVPPTQMPPRYNIAPTQPIVVVANADRGGETRREGQLVRWGFVPAWVKDPKEFTLLVNARSETAAEKPSFRTAMRHRRVLIPASGFYEWQRFGKGQKSQAYWVRPKDGGVMAFAGLMETWSDANGSEIDTACILTTQANTSFSAIHHRLPMIVHPDSFDRWLDVRGSEPREVADLLAPVDDKYLEPIPVGDAVNKVSNSGPEIQTRVKEVRSANQKPENDDQLSMF